MVINVDKDGAVAIQQLCDIALKHGGFQNYEGVGAIVRAVTIIPDEEVKE